MIKGRVQGVGFRFFTYKLAGKHHLTGWVRNSSNGAVEFEVQGVKNEVEKFLDKIKNAKYPARVTDLKISEISVDKLNDSFQVIK